MEPSLYLRLGHRRCLSNPRDAPILGIAFFGKVDSSLVDLEVPRLALHDRLGYGLPRGFGSLT